MTTLDPDILIANRIFNMVEHYKQGGRFMIHYHCSKCGKTLHSADTTWSKCIYCGEPYKEYEIVEEKENDL